MNLGCWSITELATLAMHRRGLQSLQQGGWCSRGLVEPGMRPLIVMTMDDNEVVLMSFQRG